MTKVKFARFWHFPLKHCSPLSTSSLSVSLSMCVHVCMKWCQINSESCQAKDRQKIKYKREYHYTVGINMLEDICCWDLWLSAVLLKWYWTRIWTYWSTRKVFENVKKKEMGELEACFCHWSHLNTGKKKWVSKGSSFLNVPTTSSRVMRLRLTNDADRCMTKSWGLVLTVMDAAITVMRGEMCCDRSLMNDDKWAVVMFWWSQVPDYMSLIESLLSY